MSLPTLEQFLAENFKGRSSHIVEPRFRVLYVRKGRRYCSPLDRPLEDHLCLASVEIEEEYRGQGIFTRFVNWVRVGYPDLPLIAENVLMPRFRAWFTRRGWTNLDPDNPSPSYLLLPRGDDV